MYYKGWIIALILLLAIRGQTTAKPLPVPPSLTNLVEWQDTTRSTASTEKTRQEERKTKTQEDNGSDKVQKSNVKAVPKARNQQIPRTVIPKIKSVAPKVVVKTKINTKVNIKL